MNNYIVNKNSDYSDDYTKTRHHEVHLRGCPHSPDAVNTASLGYHPNFYSAKRKAESLGYSPADGCGHCLSKHHTI